MNKNLLESSLTLTMYSLNSLYNGIAENDNLSQVADEYKISFEDLENDGYKALMKAKENKLDLESCKALFKKIDDTLENFQEAVEMYKYSFSERDGTFEMLNILMEMFDHMRWQAENCYE